MLKCRKMQSRSGTRQPVSGAEGRHKDALECTACLLTGDQVPQHLPTWYASINHFFFDISPLFLFLFFFLLYPLLSVVPTNSEVAGLSHSQGWDIGKRKHRTPWTWRTERLLHHWRSLSYSAITALEFYHPLYTGDQFSERFTLVDSWAGVQTQILLCFWSFNNTSLKRPHPFDVFMLLCQAWSNYTMGIKR
jgi:hypothetical protein